MQRGETVMVARWHSASIRAVVLSMFVLCVHACGGASASGGNSESHFLHCTHDADCATGELCVQGTCRAIVGSGGSPGDAGVFDGAGLAGSSGDGSGGGGGAAVQCPADFPTFDKSCSSDQGCTLVQHQADCCGTTDILSIREQDKLQFAQLEAACIATYPRFCGCPPRSGADLDDGIHVTYLTEALATCVDGQCKSKFNPNAYSCGYQKCAETQACEATSLGFGSYSNTCVDNPACVAKCSNNPCVTNGCQCAEKNGHVTFSCPAPPVSVSSCQEKTDAATATIDAAFGIAAADTSCTTDDDCVIASGASNCTGFCQSSIVSTWGSNVIQAAIDSVNSGVCDACPAPTTPCPPPFTVAACDETSKTCIAFPPKDWTGFALREGRGADSTTDSTPLKCDVGHDCTLWKVAVDGTVTKLTNGVPFSPRKLTAQDFATLDGILRSVEFRRIFAGVPIGCEPAPPGIRDSIELDNKYVMTTLDQTGCVQTGPSGNDVMQIYQLLQAY